RDEVAFRQPTRRKEELVRVGDADLVAADSHSRSNLSPDAAKPACTDGLRECREGEFEGNSRGAGFFSMHPIRLRRLPLKGDFGPCPGVRPRPRPAQTSQDVRRRHARGQTKPVPLRLERWKEAGRAPYRTLSPAMSG